MPDRTPRRQSPTTQRPGTHPVNDEEQPLSNHLHTPAEAAQRLAVKESWLRRKASARAIPCTFLGKHLRFSDTDLHEIIRQARLPATHPTRRH
ncbi:helix-turn-helix domain-containing protein [Saccharopolyspora phatthalungensis]|uniref:helix-turn-helix domain-containing protein n=1 Tax=Saccharopolyspora phatthalungensis TaxID=664693 RepID=UPI001609DB62|nr:helix-turn-helix domain-containing protein [Saccharopolyspora phatthalungensis]